MDINDATEEAYKNGYEDGKRDAVKHGRWVQIGYDKALDRISCSCCKDYWNIEDNQTQYFNYCPNCGARMDGNTDG